MHTVNAHMDVIVRLIVPIMFLSAVPDVTALLAPVTAAPTGINVASINIRTPLKMRKWITELPLLIPARA